MPDSSLPTPPDDDREDVRRWRYLVRESIGSGSLSVNITGTRGQHPDDIPENPNVADDEFEGLTLDTTGERADGATPWEWVNQGDATAVLTQGHLVLTDPGNTVLNMHVIRQALPAAPWTYRFKFTEIAGASTDYSIGGVCIMNNTNNRLLVFSKDYNAGWDLSVDRYTDFSTGASTITDIGSFFTPWDSRLPVYFEVECDGTNVTFRLSGSGVNGTFADIGTDALATFITSADYIGLLVNSLNSTDTVMAVEWFRRME